MNFEGSWAVSGARTKRGFKIELIVSMQLLVATKHRKNVATIRSNITW